MHLLRYVAGIREVFFWGKPVSHVVKKFVVYIHKAMERKRNLLGIKFPHKKCHLYDRDFAKVFEKMNFLGREGKTAQN